MQRKTKYEETNFVKEKLGVIFLIMHDIKAYGRSGGVAPVILPSALDAGSGKASDLGCFILGERVLCAHSVGV